MRYRKYSNTYAVRIDKGEEIMEKLKELCKAENIRFAQVSAIGAADHSILGVYDLAMQAYARETVTGFCEITHLSGNITTVNDEPYVHLHATLADQQHQIHGGHVLEMNIGATCEMFIQVMDTTVGRTHDDQLGINLWDF